MTSATHPRGAVFEAPFGPVSILADESHLLSLHFSDLGHRDKTPLLNETKRQLAAYFAGELHSFDLPLRPLGTTFQLQVWRALEDLRFGQTISYRALAERVGAPKAYRAVGGANGKNPLPILIPCHRVIAHDGKLGGYSGGLPIKTALLRLEGLKF